MDGLCLSHDPGRRAQAEAARRAGAATTGALFAAQRAQSRSAAPEHLPTRHPPRTLADVIRWASWCAWAQAVGLVDDVTVRGINRSLQSLRLGLEKRDLLRRITELERTLRAYEQRDRAARGLPAR